MLALILALACASVDTGETAYVYAGSAWRPIVDGWVDGDHRCGTMDGPCYDCVEVSTNWYVRWEFDENAAAGEEWRVFDHGNIKDVTAGDGSCTAIALGAPIPQG